MYYQKMNKEIHWKKSIWPVGLRKWQGNFSYDIFWLPGQFFSSFSQHFVRIILLLAQSVRTSPKGHPSTWLDDVLYDYILCYEVVMGHRVNQAPSDPLWCIVMIISYVILFFDLDKVSLCRMCAPLDLVKLINVKLISTIDDVIISTVGCKSK